jgi:hypothetical protein
MKSTRFCGVLGAVVVVASGAMVSAQLPESTTSREVVSATGCVQRATAGEVTAGGDGLDGGFMLRGVRVGPSQGIAKGRASGADIAPSRRDASLHLVPDRGVDLAEHVGHRVLVTGRLSSFAAPGGVASTASGRTLTVTTVSMIAPGCAVGS